MYVFCDGSHDNRGVVQEPDTGCKCWTAGRQAAKSGPVLFCWSEFKMEKKKNPNQQRINGVVFGRLCVLWLINLQPSTPKR